MIIVSFFCHNEWDPSPIPKSTVKNFYFDFIYNFIQIYIISPIYIPPLSPIITPSIQF